MCSSGDFMISIFWFFEVQSHMTGWPQTPGSPASLSHKLGWQVCITTLDIGDFPKLQS